MKPCSLAMRTNLILVLLLSTTLMQITLTNTIPPNIKIHHPKDYQTTKIVTLYVVKLDFQTIMVLQLYANFVTNVVISLTIADH